MSVLPTNIKQWIPGTEEYESLAQSKEKAREVLRMWELGITVYSQLRNRIVNNVDFYQGTNNQQFNSLTKEGELQITTNVGATILDLIVFLIANNPPNIQAIPKSSSKTDQIEASIAEAQVAKALKDSNFHTTFNDTVKMMVSFAGFANWFVFWNTEKEFGRKKNHFDMSLLNPMTTRVFYRDSDYKRVDRFITTKRMSPEAIYKMYDGFEAVADTEDLFIPQDIVGYGLDEGKTTVFKCYDEEYVTTVINGRLAEEPYKHGLDFTPIIQINNINVLNTEFPTTDLERFKPIAQELNMLISAASEIARDKAWPALLEYNTALGNRKISKWRGQKVPVRRTDKGEALAYLDNPADMGVILKQIQLLLDLLHFVALMPKAAAGIFDSTVTSGFQARIAMQPATLSTENKRISINAGLERLAKIILYMIEKYNPQALEIDGNTRLTNLHEIDFKIVWPDNLPMDIAREIQNLILGIQNNMTSVRQAIGKYNVMMGMGTTEDTLSHLQQEAKDVEINPDRALKIAQVSQSLAQMEQALASIREKAGGGVLPSQLNEGTPEGADTTQQNQTNFERAATSPLEGEEQAAPDTAREAVPTESTGGSVLPL